MLNKIIPLSFLLFTVFSLNAQEKYSKVIVYANTDQMIQLAEQGVPMDHGKRKINTFIISDFSDSELATIKASGVDYEVLMEDVQSYYQSRLTSNPKPHSTYKMGDPHLKYFRGAGCSGGSGGGNSIIDYPQPNNFSLGSMGGYLTYQEFIDNLDSMASKYPNIITAKTPIDSMGNTFLTEELNLPVYWVKISDNPNTDEPTESEIMYSAIHHAREPASLSQIIYYMWYLLENYGTDPEVTYLVDNVEMYFVPMINPDGYIYNETTQPGGGGMWRKNRKNNGGGDYGVDLNRNYSYQFGGAGTSSNPADQNYKGTHAFSEIETRAMRWFHFDHDFRIALNAHTYGDLLLHPFGYATVQTADHTLYQAYSAEMVSQNGFANILSADLYPAAGDSDDWGYADDLGLKPKVLSMTPEIGDDNHGFWPASNEIIDICKGTVYMNLMGAHLTWTYGFVSDQNSYVIEDLTGHLKYDVQRYGQEPGNLTVSINPVGFGIQSVGGSNTHNLANVLDSETDSISYTLDPTIQIGQAFQYELVISNGAYAWRDTITKIYGQSTVVFAGTGNMADWTSSDWAATSADFYSPSTSITDSPGGEYQNGTSSHVTLNQTIDLTNAVVATANFYAKWEIEDNWDYAQFMVSSDGGNSWIPMCGLYTQTGSNDQDAGEPVYDGFQTSWVKEEVDLVDFLGQTIQVRFRMEADNFVTEDGFYFDDFEINMIEQEGIGIDEIELSVEACMPNPAVSFTYIPYHVNGNDASLELYDSFGKLISTYSLVAGKEKFQLNVENLAAGVYVYKLRSAGTVTQGKRLVVVK